MAPAGTQTTVFAARFSDGRTAASNQAQVRFDTTGLTITAPSHIEPIRWPYARLRSAQPLTAKSKDVLVTDRLLEGATLFVSDPRFVDELRWRAPHLTASALRWQHARPWVIFGVTAASLIALFWLVDFSPAKTAAHLLPERARQMLGQQVMSQMIGRRKVCDAAEPRAALDKLADRLQSAIPGKPTFRIVVVDWGLVNAFATPGSQIVLTRGLIAQAESADEVAGVLAHEMGHGLELHPETGIVRAIGLSAAAELVMGGGSGTLTNLGLMLAQLRYSRGAEREADEIALKILKDAKVSATGLKAFLSRMRKTEGGAEGTAFDILRTHPATLNRIEMIEAQPSYPATPVIATQDWTRLRVICGGAAAPEVKPDDKSGAPDSTDEVSPRSKQPRQSPQPTEPQIRL